MNADTLRRYIADAEATPRMLSSADDWAALRTHQSNATPKLFAALCRYALAGMDHAAPSEDDAEWDNQLRAYSTALRALKELP